MLPWDNRRSSIQIVAEILRLLRLGEAGKTEVMYVVQLTHRQTQSYLNRLLDVGLIDEASREGRPTSYVATQDGLQLLRSIEAMQEMLRSPEALGATALAPKARERGLGRLLTRLGRLASRG